MYKVVSLFILLMVTVSACAGNTKGGDKNRNANVIVLPGHHLSPGEDFGKIIYTRITNTSDHIITLHPIMPANNANDSAGIIQMLLAGVKFSSDTDNIRLQLIQQTGHFLKSPNKVSLYPNFKDNNYDSQVSRVYSLTGSAISLPSWHCDNFCKEAIYLLEATKYFTDSDFILQHCRIHTALQVKLHTGDTVFADMTVGTPVFMVKNKARRYGWASLSDIQNDTNLINSAATYLYIRGRDTINLCTYRTINNYKAIFALPWAAYIYKASAHVLDNFTTDLVLAPAQTIEYRDTIGYVIDTTINNYHAMIADNMHKVADFGVFVKRHKDSGYTDSAQYYLYHPYSVMLHLPDSLIPSIYDAGRITLYNKSKNWMPGYLPNRSVLYSYIPASKDTLYYGVQTSLPFVITKSVSVSNGATTDSFNVSFYGDRMFNTVPAIADVHYNYANGIGSYKYIAPNTTVSQTLLYNSNVLNFFAGGRMFIASDKGIKVEVSDDASSTGFKK